MFFQLAEFLVYVIRGLIPCSQGSANRPYNDPDKFNPPRPTHICFKIHFNIILSSTPVSPYWTLCFRFCDWHFYSLYISPLHSTVLTFDTNAFLYCGSGNVQPLHYGHYLFLSAILKHIRPTFFFLLPFIQINSNLVEWASHYKHTQFSNTLVYTCYNCKVNCCQLESSSLPTYEKWVYRVSLGIKHDTSPGRCH
jgi:hypothetical protein